MAPLKASGTSKERIGGGLSTNKLHMNIAFMTWRRVFLNIKCESNTGSVRLFPVSVCLFAAAPLTIAGFLWWFSSLLGTFFFLYQLQVFYADCCLSEAVVFLLLSTQREGACRGFESMWFLPVLLFAGYFVTCCVDCEIGRCRRRRPQFLVLLCYVM